MFNTLNKLLRLLNLQERRQAGLLLVMFFVMSLLDMLGVASIMPFMAILADPQLIETNTILAYLFDTLGFTETHSFLLFIGVMVFFVLVISLAFKALTTYTQIRFIHMCEHSISRRLVEGYLHQPYVWFLRRHSADLGKTVLSEVNQVITGALLPMMTLVSQSTVALGMLTLLLIVDPKLTLTVIVVMGGAYGVTYLLVSNYLSHIGSEYVKSNKKRFTALTEAFGGIKEVKIGGLESIYLNRFSQPSETYAKHRASASSISQLPRFALEAFTFGGMILIILYLMSDEKGIVNMMPIIALYAFAGYRLMPALQQIYNSITQVRFTRPALESLYADISNLNSSDSPSNGLAPLNLMREIKLNGVSYRYPEAEQKAIQSLNLTIPVKTSIGLVGSTGSGKTTAVDLILGLLEPDIGSLDVDGVTIDSSNRSQWQSAIGYVPQHIFLTDDTLAANIAFGIAPELIDQEVVERAARIANLHDFIISEMPLGYATTVGERGVRLSGGQRQRIGIARALYNNPQVLILDEATSALDNITEQAVMDAVHNLGRKITIVLIAHRLSTVRECDQIFIMQKGRILEHGSYEELQKNSQSFREMTGTKV